MKRHGDDEIDGKVSAPSSNRASREAAERRREIGAIFILEATRSATATAPPKSAKADHLAVRNTLVERMDDRRRARLAEHRAAFGSRITGRAARGAHGFAEQGGDDAGDHHESHRRDAAPPQSCGPRTKGPDPERGALRSAAREARRYLHSAMRRREPPRAANTEEPTLTGSDEWRYSDDRGVQRLVKTDELRTAAPRAASCRPPRPFGVRG